MKVTELFEKKLIVPTSQKSISGIIQNPQLQHLGTGVQAIAYLHKKFPDKVIKTIAISGENDPSYQFLRLSMNHPENPYFPKIYNVKKYNMDDLMDKEREELYSLIDPTDTPPEQTKYVLLVVMEKLTPLNNTESVVRLLQQHHILPNDLNVFKDTLYGASKPLHHTQRAFNQEETRNKMVQHAPNIEFKKAMRLLEPLFRKFSPDLRYSNIMMRGDQLVLVDPVC